MVKNVPVYRTSRDSYGKDELDPQDSVRFHRRACAVGLDLCYWLLATPLARDAISAASLFSLVSDGETFASSPVRAGCRVVKRLVTDICVYCKRRYASR